MLAQNFKTPTTLGISDREHAALVKVLGMLEREELKHVEWACSTFGFNMELISVHNECGTMACLMGWAQIIGGADLFDMETVGPNQCLLDLFLFIGKKRSKFINNIDRREVKPAQAAIALRNYLTRGKACWQEALIQ